MNLKTQPIPVEATPQTDTTGPRDWLDALSSGACDQAAFLRSVNELLSTAPDEGWEMLSLIDQYYRRGKLTADVFRSLNSHLQALLMGNSRAAGSNASGRSTVFRTAPVQARVPAVPTTAVLPMQLPMPPATATLLRAASETVKVVPPAAATGATGATPMVGELLRSRYRILGVLGQGAMGTVFEAIDQYRMEAPDDSQKVAVKVLHPAVAQRPELLDELRREFQHLQSLSHPNIVRVHEFDRDGNTAFFTMECLGGLLLSRVLSVREDAPMYRPHALGIIRDVGAAIAHAHGRNVVHGDLNPGNVFVTDTGNVRVLNFGASYVLHRGGAVSEFDPIQRFPDTASIYASAQVLEGDPADARDDIYAFACMAYVLLTGQHPFQQYTAIKARSLRLVPERPDGLGRRQWQTLRAGLFFERDQRPTDMQAWLEKLALRADSVRLPALPALMTARTRTSRGGIWVLAAAALTLLAGAGWWAAQNANLLRPGVRTLREQAKPMLDTARSSLSDTWNKARQAAASPPPPVAQQAPRPAPKSIDTAGTPAAATSGAAPGTPVYPSTLARSRIELGSDTVQSAANDPVARITVRRLGSLRGNASFTWWTESGTAKPGRDFTAVKPQLERFEDGRASVTLLVPIIAQATRPTDRSFYVVIDEPSSNATLGARTLTMVTIPAN